jgi:cyclohexadieny/prephenate dehydrogenase
VTYAHDNVVILGLGLIGGSLARALREAGFSKRLIGCGYREPSLRRGVELGVIDEFTLDLDEAFDRADILVICTPTLKAADVVEKLLPRMGTTGPVVTDVASVKGNLLDVVRKSGESFPARLVLGHPIAGSERSGVEASEASLFQNHRVILTPQDENEAEAVALVRSMWESVGAQVIDMSVETHDAVLAATSHLPHVLAYSLVDALASSNNSEAIFECAAGGFRDFTRIASSDPVMWRDIALANRDALLEAIDTFGDSLQRLRSAVADSDGSALEDTFGRAKKARDDFADILAQRERKK